MRSTRSGLLSLAAMAAFALGAGAAVEAPAATATQKAMLSTRVPAMPSLRKLLGWDGGSTRRHRRPGPGWTHAHVQRMAHKRRNQARHRKACKRRGHA